MSVGCRLIDRENVLYLVDQLQDFEKDKAIKSGLRAAVNIFRVGGQKRLSQRLKKGKYGHLRNSFTTRVKRNKIGALAGFDRPGGNHSHLVDLGTQLRETKGKKSKPAGLSRGRMPANSFWEDTNKQDEDKAMNKLYQGIQKAVERINNRR